MLQFSFGTLPIRAGHSIGLPLVQPQNALAATFLAQPLGSSGSAATTRESSR
jgi:hypothetical protein